ncbi:hypothetical protein SAMN02799622_05992 [Methylobacterium sp. UNC378MF]|uniref:DUF2946 domain-containing protein n=1 Tax=Methylobacterium sp. UNC378MF TaxID=1502748 RepID=UPI0008903574|nr:DUF2946 domain-containing protein [Methylobacterium sp. UNC378MF]SDA35102.1 hypothetical protein SAMN02799622_05992 [Methylobacterium sp. UNC378MF]
MPVQKHPPLKHRHPGLLGAGLIVLALWIQALAPAVALRMAQATAALPGLILCGHAPDQAVDAGIGPLAPAMAGCGLCGLCRAGAVPPLLPTLPGLAHHLRWETVAWLLPPSGLAASAVPVLGQPRGPPRFA